MRNAKQAPNGKRTPKTYVKIWDDPKWVRPPRVLTDKNQNPEPQKMNWVARKEWWERQILSDDELTLADLKVAAYIRWRLNSEEGHAFPNFETIAADTGLAKSTVVHCIKKLEARGHLQVERRSSGRRHYANRYIALVVVSDRTVLQLHDCTVAQLHYRDGSAATLPEPETLPETDNLRSIPETLYPTDIAPTDVGAPLKGSEEDALEPMDPPEQSLKADCFALAREKFGEDGPTWIGKYVPGNASPQEWGRVYNEIVDSEDVNHLAGNLFMLCEVEAKVAGRKRKTARKM